MSSQSLKGYRLAKSTNGIQSGAWYFEVEILQTATTASSVRVGWSQISGDLQAPCGFDSFSYAFRPSPATVFTQSKGQKYGCDAGPGDFIGMAIILPEESLLEDTGCEPWPAPWKGQSYVPVKYEGKLPIHRGSSLALVLCLTSRIGSEVRFFVNGVDQGVAFTDLHRGRVSSERGND
jgi:hypothetical protein